MGSGDKGLYIGTFGAITRNRMQASSMGVDEVERQKEKEPSYNVGSTLDENLTTDFLRDYPVSEAGYFGVKGKGHGVRVIHSDDVYVSAWKFFQRISKGGHEIGDANHGVVVTLDDKTTITYRVVTKSKGSPAVDINISGSSYNGKVKGQKVHFVTGRGGTKNGKN